ncbi:jg8398 [Pararge aegeria aegeria]|uniref:Jg8398 protein n=1 Tax=Pararge aegeria aegeria TaxID=348720 RepID=A0A8S4SMY7_9NEOP|nr:jg8398 [Pararge aegeria aegeria]
MQMAHNAHIGQMATWQSEKPSHIHRPKLHRGCKEHDLLSLMFLQLTGNHALQNGTQHYCLAVDIIIAVGTSPTLSQKALLLLKHATKMNTKTPAFLFMNMPFSFNLTARSM